MLVNAQKLQSQWGCRENCGHGATIVVHSLSQPFGLPAPSEREPGTPLSGRVPFIVSPGNRKGAGDFHRPYETLMILDFTIQRNTREF